MSQTLPHNSGLIIAILQNLKASDSILTLLAIKQLRKDSVALENRKGFLQPGGTQVSTGEEDTNILGIAGFFLWIAVTLT